MLKVYEALGQAGIDRFISDAMTYKGWSAWAFMQSDRVENNSAPVKFILVTEPKIKLATIQVLCL